MSHRVAVVTGTRAEFGLLRSTLYAIDRHPDLDLVVIAGGAHLLPPARTIDEVCAEFDVAVEVPFQQEGETGRDADAAAFGRGALGMAAAFRETDPAVVVVLGDRIEACAAAAAASIGGRRVVHIHGGDRAEGVADEAMRHAITALAHLHLAATPDSGDRLLRMGQDPATVRVVGSPAVDGLEEIGVLADADHAELGAPRTLLLQHGTGLAPDVERAWIESALEAAARHGPVLALRPNADPGSDVILQALQDAAGREDVTLLDHLPRARFVACLRRMDAIVGNSSAGLIEAAIVGCPAVNLGPRQGGRERPGSVVDVAVPGVDAIHAAILEVVAGPRRTTHPYGDSGAGERIAAAIAVMMEEGPSGPPRKRLAH